MSASVLNSDLSALLASNFEAIGRVAQLARAGHRAGIIICPRCRGELHFQIGSVSAGGAVRSAGQCATRDCIDWRVG